MEHEPLAYRGLPGHSRHAYVSFTMIAGADPGVSVEPNARLVQWYELERS